MSVAAQPLLKLESSFAEHLDGLCLPWQAAGAPQPRLLVLNEELAAELGADTHRLRSEEGLGLFTGSALPPGSRPVAQAYAGHQFGGYSPRLGDGRALLLGEVVDVCGRLRDVHLKGSGRTPFARGGDGKAAVGPMLREYVVGEAMHALGIPSTRALAVVASGEEVARERYLPGAVLTRVAASHLRVGTFQYAASLQDPDLLRRLTEYAIERHHPHAAEAENPALALFEAVVEAQAELIARWMLVAFVHGVMNTDNMTISGETIDYGPCAFMDGFDPATVFSSIDHGGRYAYGNQPLIAQWNLARLAEALLGLMGEDREQAAAAATEVLRSYPDRFNAHWRAGMRGKLGVCEPFAGEDELVAEILGLLKEHEIDYTTFFRSLADELRGRDGAARSLFGMPEGFDAWAARWRAQVADPAAAADAMDRVNPVYIPRNHLVEEALAAGTGGDLEPFHRLLDAVTRPFEARPGLERYAAPAPAAFCDGFQTFCGT